VDSRRNIGGTLRVPQPCTRSVRTTLATEMHGILDRPIHDTPIAVLDFETTGLTPGHDRVVEVSVVRRDPGQRPRLVLDTLVNPLRPMAATEIHGITDDDVREAPRFEEIAGELLAALSDCVMAAYNVYFDLKFLRYELQQAGVAQVPPHLCLMYLRPMLGLGCRCKLEEACRAHGIHYQQSHVAAHDAQASAELLELYLQDLRQRQIHTFHDLARLGSYKFTQSWTGPPLSAPRFSLPRAARLWSRVGHVPQRSVDPLQAALRSYWDTLKAVVADLVITDEELADAVRQRQRLGLNQEQIRFLHAKAFESAIAQFVDDQRIDDLEARKLQLLHQALAKLGWAPGQ
jgi:DNA polymerase-3 subunit epsilon